LCRLRPCSRNAAVADEGTSLLDPVDGRGLLGEPFDHGGTDAEPRWISPREIPRPGQRGAHSSGWLVARFLRCAAEGGGRSSAAEETAR
jgi:hypothetical protein